MNVVNLEKLADYLEGGKLLAKFDMGRYDECRRAHICDDTPVTTCGSVGCAIGHGPYAGIEKFANESWLEYSARVFSINPFSNEWWWCFNLNWRCVDNTPEGAAKRIRFLIENRGAPEGFSRFDLTTWDCHI